MFQPEPSKSYCKDDQDNPDQQHTDTLETAEARRSPSHPLLPPFQEFKESGSLTEKRPTHSRRPACQKKSRLGRSGMLVGEKRRKRSAFAPGRRTISVGGRSHSGPAVVPKAVPPRPALPVLISYSVFSRHR